MCVNLYGGKDLLLSLPLEWELWYSSLKRTIIEGGLVQPVQPTRKLKRWRCVAPWFEEVDHHQLLCRIILWTFHPLSLGWHARVTAKHCQSWTSNPCQVSQANIMSFLNIQVKISYQLLLMRLFVSTFKVIQGDWSYRWVSQFSGVPSFWLAVSTSTTFTFSVFGSVG